MGALIVIFCIIFDFLFYLGEKMMKYGKMKH